MLSNWHDNELINLKAIITFLIVGIIWTISFALVYVQYINSAILVFCSIYIFISTYTINRSGLLSFGSIFVYGFTLFVGTKIALYPFSTSVQFMASQFTLSDKTNAVISGVWVWILFLFLFGYSIFPKTPVQIRRYPVSKVTYVILVIVISFVAIKSVMLMLTLLDKGYYYLYIKGNSLDLTLARLIAILLISIMAYRSPNSALNITPFILVLAICYLITGVRANALVLFIYLGYIYFETRSKPPNLIKFISVVVSIIGILLFVQWYRQGFAWTSDLGILEYVIRSAHRTFYLPGILMEHGLARYSSFSILSLLSKLICEACTTGDILSAYMYGDLYKAGHGVGGIGFFDVFYSFLGPVGGSILIFLVGIFSSKLESKPKKYYVLYPIIFLTFYSHRSNIGYYMIMIILFYFTLTFRELILARGPHK